ncbi:MAG: hypothetical protein P1V13_22345 [Rhizobiaceae bacterium]|nr:hypothetical protein [Rhizobiaceae bacterium]
MRDSFPLLFAALPKGEDKPPAPPKVDYGIGGRGSVVPLFEASVRGVRSRFPHLSEADIASPPHQWFDAALARQIALYLLVEEFAVPKRAVAEELARSREAVNRALRTVEDRLQFADFQDAYSQMALSAQEALSEGSDHEQD